MNHQNRAHAATRTPVEQIAQICAQKAASARGDLQQEWFELGSYVSRFAGMGQPAGEGQRTMAAGG